jgi:hypothetical protein
MNCWAGVNRVPEWMFCALLAAGRAALALHDGDLETAESDLAEAVRLLRDVPMPLEQCRMLTAYGAVLGRRGQRDRARQLSPQEKAVA